MRAPLIKAAFSTVATTSKQNQQPLSSRQIPDYQLYERLKAEYTATATTPAEYEAACRRAAQEAGV